MSLDRTICITVPAAQYRYYTLVKDITICGPEEKMTPENINKIVFAVSEFFTAGRNRLNQMEHFGQDPASHTFFYVVGISARHGSGGQAAKVRFNKALADLETAFKTTGLTAKEFREIGHNG